MPNDNQKGWLEAIGCAISEWVASVAAHPLAQVGVILFCALWWTLGLPTDILTAGLSILAITLTQMVLNRQGERELDAHRRDVAMHAKLDELVLAGKNARNEMAGIEELDEEEIEELKEEAKTAIDAAGEEAGEPHEREAAKRAVEAASQRVAAAAKKAKPTKRRRSKAT